MMGRSGCGSIDDRLPEGPSSRCASTTSLSRCCLRSANTAVQLCTLCVCTLLVDRNFCSEGHYRFESSWLPSFVVNYLTWPTDAFWMEIWRRMSELTVRWVCWANNVFPSIYHDAVPDRCDGARPSLVCDAHRNISTQALITLRSNECHTREQ